MAVKEKVSLVRCHSYSPAVVRESLAELLRPWGGMTCFVGRGRRVLLKPNLLTAAAPEEAVTTHPAVVLALAGAVREAGGIPVVGDSPGRFSLERVCEAAGLADPLRKAGVELLPLDRAAERTLGGRTGRTVPLAAALEEVDAVINIPKLKTHSLTGLTGAVKNTYGCVVGRAKAHLHREYPLAGSFAHLLLDIYLAVKPVLHVADAVVVMEGPGPRAGRPRAAGFLLASPSGVALDTVAAVLTGFLPGEVTTLAAARERKIPGAMPGQVQVEGLPLEECVLPNFDRGAVPGRNLASLLWRFPFSWFKNRQEKSRPFPRIRETCTGCGTCLEHCPPQVMRVEGGRACIELERCIRCYCCQELCPQKCIDLVSAKNNH